MRSAKGNWEECVEYEKHVKEKMGAWVEYEER